MSEKVSAADLGFDYIKAGDIFRNDDKNEKTLIKTFDLNGEVINEKT